MITLEDFDAPLRLTQREWDRLFDGRLGDDAVFRFPRFMLTRETYALPARPRDALGCDFTYVVTVTLRQYARPTKTFGPYRRVGLAEQKARDYLVRYHAIQIIEEEGVA